LAAAAGTARCPAGRYTQAHRHARRARCGARSAGAAERWRSLGHEYHAARVMRPRALSLTLWLALVALSVLIVARAHYTADLSAFLPRSPSATQQLLVQQLQDGLASRLLLIGIEGGDAAR